MTLWLAGKKFGKLSVTNEVISRIKNGRSRRYWRCRCDCGCLTWVEPSNLINKNSTTCGKCWRGFHHHTTRTWQSPTYKSWASMHSRCSNPNYSGYALYGGRGISVCRRWDKFENFLSDMGDRPAGKTIEREDVNKNYTPSNCRWATSKEQGQNRRTNKLSLQKAARMRALYRRGIIKAELARQFGVSFAAVARVIDGSRWVSEA